MNEVSFPIFLVLDTGGLLTGILTLRDLKGILAHPEQLQSGMCAADFMSRDLVTVNEHDEMERVFHFFAEYPCTLMPVVRANNPRKAVGVIREASLVTAYGEHVRIPLNPITDSTPFRSLIPLIPAKVSERSDAVFC